MLSKQLQEQIEQEAIDGQQILPATEYSLGINKGYEIGYEAAGDKYGQLYETALARAERAEKALNLIAQMSDPGDHWVAICKMKSIASDVINHKTCIDE